MPQANAAIHSLNAGEVSRLALARVDLAKMRLACEQQENFFPKVLGPARMRPGTGHLFETASSADGILKEFVFTATSKALLELTPNVLRIASEDVLLTRPAVTATVTNGEFTTDLAGWTNNDEAGASSYWLGGTMLLVGSGNNYAIREQTVVIVNPGVEHALRITISRGRVSFKVGSVLGADDYVRETILRAGVHSLAFTPGSGGFYIWVANQTTAVALVDSILLEGAGIVNLPTPWGASDLINYRQKQSGDVMFVTCGTAIQPRRIERRSQRSWSIVLFEPDNGPFRLPNITPTTITPSATAGSITLTSSRNLFRSGHVGAIFKLIHAGQSAVATLGGANQFTSHIRVSGLTADRGITIDISGTFVATVTLQRSLGAPGSWTDVVTYTAPTSVPYNDNLDNQIIYYRLGIKTGDYTSGSLVAAISYANSSQIGVARITGYTNATTVLADVIVNFGAALATLDWQEGKWSSFRGYPVAVDIHDGRLVFAARDEIIASVSDAYESFDEEVEGDSGPIIRSIATGSFDAIYWLLSLQRLLVGTASQEVSIRSSSFDEPLTPTKFTARRCSSRGNCNVQAVVVDSTAIFVQRNKRNIFELRFSSEGGDYAAGDLTRLKPEMCQSGVVSMAIQRQPDTRIWHVLADGTAAVLTYERADEVMAWTKFSMSNGLIKSVAILPSDDEDEVYFLIARTVGGILKHYVEKLAKESEAIGGVLNKVMDGHVLYTAGIPTSTINGLSHLNGLQVVVWAEGAPLVTQGAMLTVVAGQITLPSPVTNAVVGLPFNGRIKSAKLSYAAGGGTALAQKQRVDHLGLLMADVGWKGVRIGRDFTNMNGLNTTYEGKTLTATQVMSSYDCDASSFNGGWDTDSRFCVEVQAPYPATLLGVVVSMATNDVTAAPRQKRPARNTE